MYIFLSNLSCFFQILDLVILGVGSDTGVPKGQR